MKLSELLVIADKCTEFTIFDNVYDIEFYMDGGKPCEVTADAWDRAMFKIAESLDVVTISNTGVTTNLTEVVERAGKNHQDVFDELFIDTDIDAIMCDMDNILAGCVSEKWLTKFAECL